MEFAVELYLKADNLKKNSQYVNKTKVKTVVQLGKIYGLSLVLGLKDGSIRNAGRWG